MNNANNAQQSFDILALYKSDYYYYYYYGDVTPHNIVGHAAVDR